QPVATRRPISANPFPTRNRNPEMGRLSPRRRTSRFSEAFQRLRQTQKKTGKLSAQGDLEITLGVRPVYIRCVIGRDNPASPIMGHEGPFFKTSTRFSLRAYPSLNGSFDVKPPLGLFRARGGFVSEEALFAN